MSEIPKCGDAPVEGAMAISIADGVSLVLIRSAKGYCFSSWSRHDQGPTPIIDGELIVRVFDTEAAATDFFRELYRTMVP
jgi:hypothetical protein